MREFLSSFDKLQFGALKDLIIRHSQTPEGAALAGSMVPLSDAAGITAELDLVSEMRSFLDEGGFLRFDPLGDLAEALRRAEIDGYVLSAAELLAVRKLITNARLTKSVFKGVARSEGLKAIIGQNHLGTCRCQYTGHQLLVELIVFRDQ